MTEFVSKIPSDWNSFKKTAYQNAKAAIERSFSEELLENQYLYYPQGSLSWYHRELAGIYRKFLAGEITKKEGAAQVQQIQQKFDDLNSSIQDTLEFLEAISKVTKNVNKTSNITFQCPCGATAYGHIYIRGKRRGISAKCNQCGRSIIS